MIPGIIIFLSLIIFLYLFGNLLTGYLQDHFIFRGKTVPNDFNYHFSKSAEEFVFQTEDGGSIHSVLFKVNSNEKSKKLVVFFHGNTGNLSRWKGVAHQFKRRGYDVMIPDYRGYGKSRGKRNEKTFLQDALMVYDHMTKYYSESEVIVYGKSIGTAPASYVAGHRNPSKVILETPFYSMIDLFYAYYKLLPRWFHFKYHFKNYAYLKLAHCPIHIIAAGKDLVVPKRSSLKLKSVLKEKDEFILIEQGQHNDLAMYEIFQEFLDRNLN